MSNKPSRLKVWAWALLHHPEFNSCQLCTIKVWWDMRYGRCQLSFSFYGVFIPRIIWEDYANANGIDIYA